MVIYGYKLITTVVPEGTTTLSITTFMAMPLSIKDLRVTLSIRDLP
jgi:hypothetical protein